MKRIAMSAAVALLFLLPGTSAFGQVTLSVWGGVNVATMIRTPVDGRPERTGNAHGHVQRRAIGVAVGIPISGSWGIQLNLSDSRKGRDISSPHHKGMWKHDYSELSVLADLALELGDGDRAWLHLRVGPALARKRSCEVTVKVGGRTIRNENCAEGGWKPFKDRDYGVVGGAEVEFALSGRVGATFAGLYTYGLLDINDEPEWGYVEKNRTLTLRAGLQFSIG